MDRDGKPWGTQPDAPSPPASDPPPSLRILVSLALLSLVSSPGAGAGPAALVRPGSWSWVPVAQVQGSKGAGRVLPKGAKNAGRAAQGPGKGSVAAVGWESKLEVTSEGPPEPAVPPAPTGSSAVPVPCSLSGFRALQSLRSRSDVCGLLIMQGALPGEFSWFEYL